jgi:serine protease Do
MGKSRTLPYLLGAVAGLAVGLAVLVALLVVPGSHFRHGAPPPPASSAPDAASLTSRVADRENLQDVDNEIEMQRKDAIVEATRSVSPSVVSINAFQRTPGAPRSLDELLDFFFSGGQTQPMSQDVGMGSGLIVDHRGYVLTNYHVIANADEIVVTLSDGQHFAAEMISGIPGYDLALVKIKGEASGLPEAQLGDSDQLEIGEWAIAIGSPFGYLLADTSPTVTVGVISALHRDIKGDEQGKVGGAYYYDMIQTDAAINPGNSGGPLVNSRGEVIGINTFVIAGRGGGSVGIGFAVPINRGRWMLEEVAAYGRVRRVHHGIAGIFLSPYVRSRYPFTRDMPRGLLVTDVAPGSPADLAGILRQDVLVAIDGEPIGDERALVRQTYEAHVGTELELTVWRAGKMFPVKLTLVEDPAEASRAGG